MLYYNFFKGIPVHNNLSIGQNSCQTIIYLFTYVMEKPIQHLE